MGNSSKISYFSTVHSLIRVKPKVGLSALCRVIFKSNPHTNETSKFEVCIDTQHYFLVPMQKRVCNKVQQESF